MGIYRVFAGCDGDMRLMEDVTGRGHANLDRSPSSAVYVILKD